ncbi:MAG: M2 family metallopeptidase [Deltaproteobacteria bacterium]|nr:MAG: M2 family metallopeptidase [Deltaproteobacteria bacterium]TMQ23984.1 MAG: M2 family metallopeptidase [Deltaproteobacteria bacterium]
MRTLLLPSVLILAASCGHPSRPAEPADPALVAEARQFVAELDRTVRQLTVDASLASWANETDLTPEHEAATARASEAQSVEITKLVKAARKFDPILGQLDPDTRRQLILLKFQAQPSPDDPAQARELAELAAKMDSEYGKGVCKTVDGKETCEDIEYWSKLLQKDRAPDHLLAAWKTWHDEIGHKERDLFVKYVALANAGARGIGFSNVASLWKSGYDMPEDQFVATVDRLWGQVKPLYDQLHCYTRRKLNEMYGDQVVPKAGLIPSHLLGNMWAQSWDYLYPELEPYKGVAPIDVTPVLEKHYDARQMVQIGEAFYTSLGMDPLPASFWQRSQLTKPRDKNVVCHASAWDVQYNNDLRIKMCINLNQEDLWTIHHELGHDYYFHYYYQLPVLYQSGANDGFHEAIGDAIQLSMTPAYLKAKGLLAEVVKNDKATINQQMQTALGKISFLPFGLLVDKWRWDVFSGKVAPAQYNQHWWDLKKQYQGVAPPVPRAATDFDPGAKYHVAANVPYMRYFLAAVLQFQFHKALCAKADYHGPLYDCSIYGNKNAGAAYMKMLALGASRPWQDALFELTGTREMDASAILEYFAPLQGWLQQQNKGQRCGW